MKPLTAVELGTVRLWLDLQDPTAAVSILLARRLVATLDQRERDREAVDSLIATTKG